MTVDDSRGYGRESSNESWTRCRRSVWVVEASIEKQVRPLNHIKMQLMILETSTISVNISV